MKIFDRRQYDKFRAFGFGRWDSAISSTSEIALTAAILALIGAAVFVIGWVL